MKEEDGYTGLHHAAKLGNLEIVNMLLETGQVDVNAQVSRRRRGNLRLATPLNKSRLVLMWRFRTAGAGRPSSGPPSTNTWT